MTSPHYADLAARLLKAREPAEIPASAQSRSNSIAEVEKALRRKAEARTRRKRLTYIGGAFGVAATIALAVGLAMHTTASPVSAQTPKTNNNAVTVVAHPSGGASVVASSGAPPTTLGEGRQLERGSRVVAGPSGRALLAFSTGTQLTVEESGDLTVVENGSEQRFRLGSGKVHAEVAKLHQGERFLVETADTEVEVRGTSFDVAVVDPVSSCGNGVRTRVSVREGVVVVRHDGTEDRLLAGDQWPRDCNTAVATTHPTIVLTPTVRQPAPPSAVNTATTQQGKTSLAAQNDLFERGLAAKRSGNNAEAAAIFDRFLVNYPQSPLLESVTVERMRALRKTDPVRARDAAKKYLDAYPSGDARPEAEAFLAQSP
jgi:FecR protein